MATPHQCINWLFGRGISIACNLSWSVPTEWHTLPREDQIARITNVLRDEMDRPDVDCSVIENLLELLKKHTATGWSSRFITTNWDYLLQRKIMSLGLSVRPPWLANSQVFHLNGTVESLPNNEHRSPFLLERDSAAQRTSTTEANIAFNQMMWDRMFVVVGMSFECEIDKFLLSSLSSVEDELPIGESDWIVVNPDLAALKASCARINSALPHATVRGVHTKFASWLDGKLPELQAYGVIAF
jgi:hypothetical protein